MSLEPRCRHGNIRSAEPCRDCDERDALRAQVDDLKAAGRQARDDATAALDLVSRIRMALNDNGKRMQDELLEYCRELVESERYLEDAKAAFKEHTDRLESQISAAALLTQQALKREKHYREALEVIADPSTACFSWSETVHCLRAHARNAINQKP